jgi:transcriptional regulator with XRE-family HTH domain/uncharacterized protein YuzE
MKYLYDQERDALTVFFADRKAVDTQELWPNVIIDLDSHGVPVSIEFLENASDAVDVKGLASTRIVRVTTPSEFDDAPKITGQLLRTRRKGLGLTQQELGELLSVTANSIARWERGEANIEHPAMLSRALDALEHSKTAQRHDAFGTRRRISQTRGQTPLLQRPNVRQPAHDPRSASTRETPGSGRKRR